MAMFFSMRLPISSTSFSLMGVTSGRPMKRRASSGLHSTLMVNFIGGAPSREPHGTSIERAQEQESAMGEWVQVQGKDGAFKAYVARPAGPAKAGVIVIQ